MPRARSRRSSRAVCVSASIWPRISAAFAGSPLRELPGEPSLDGERDELLLGAVVDVAFQAPAFLVLGGHQALTRRPHVLDQPHVAQDETRLRGQVPHQLLLGRAHRVGRGHPEGERTEQLAPVAHLRHDLTGTSESARSGP